MKKPIIAAFIATSIAFPAYAFAQFTPRAERRLENQDERIERGIESGQLTRREARRLEYGQDHVQALENRALRDGRVSQRERHRIERAQDIQNRRIYTQRHDRQRSWWSFWD